MSKKKQVREAFRQVVFARDKNRCRKCGRADVRLDAHHITDRHELPNGGYVQENGISLCDQPDGCHFKAEEFHRTGTALPGYSPDELYALIGSSRAKAEEASRKLDG